MNSRVLYISYDGMLEPLGQSQVLAYQELLAPAAHLHLLSFEKPEDCANADVRHSVEQRIKASGIQWHPRSYHKRPSAVATTFDILVGIASGLWVVLHHRIAIVHARSYVSAVMALALKKLTGVRFLFDMRGFWADERVDGGIWPREGRMYRVAKWFERHFLRNADHVISLTQAAVREMEQFPYLQGRMPPITVIPTCADLSRFKPLSVKRDGFVLGYVGSAGTWYEFDAAVACFAELLRHKLDARFLIINRNEHEYIRERLLAGGVPLDAVELRPASHTEVPQQMARMHAGIFFYKPSSSRSACAPTKLGEFLGCGIPCLANSGVGDMAEILEGEQVGIALDDFTPESLRQGLTRLLSLVETNGIQQRCVAAAEKHFSLTEGVARYAQVYTQLTEPQ